MTEPDRIRRGCKKPTFDDTVPKEWRDAVEWRKPTASEMIRALKDLAFKSGFKLSVTPAKRSAWNCLKCYEYRGQGEPCRFYIKIQEKNVGKPGQVWVVSDCYLTHSNHEIDPCLFVDKHSARLG
jgi:hypothetical protein